MLDINTVIKSDLFEFDGVYQFFCDNSLKIKITDRFQFSTLFSDESVIFVDEDSSDF